MPDPYQRTVEELQTKAVYFWPKDLLSIEASSSVLPLLLETQEKFISILHVADSSPYAWKQVLQTTYGMPANLFLKHLMILTDLGGENLERLTSHWLDLFTQNKLEFIWNSHLFTYTFQSSSRVNRWTNKKLHVDGKGLSREYPLDGIKEDVIMLLLHGSSALNATLPDFVRERCVVGGLLGQRDELKRFVKQRYIVVSRILAGATSNSLGQTAQRYVKDYLEEHLVDWVIKSNSVVPGISQNTGFTDINFDIVAKSASGKYFAIEVSFQVTTNSVIERKAGQSNSRAQALRQAGHKIAYVLDGAGNFERQAALRTICQNSDCTVAFTKTELETLIDFLKKHG